MGTKHLNFPVPDFENEIGSYYLTIPNFETRYLFSVTCSRKTGKMPGKARKCRENRKNAGKTEKVLGKPILLSFVEKMSRPIFHEKFDKCRE
jgi:hypothetical protein